MQKQFMYIYIMKRDQILLLIYVSQISPVYNFQCLCFSSGTWLQLYTSTTGGAGANSSVLWMVNPNQQQKCPGSSTQMM